MVRQINFPVESVWVLGSTSEIARCLCIELAERGCKRFHLLARNLSLNNSFKNFLSKKYNVMVTTQFIDLSEEKVDAEFETMQVKGFRLGMPPPTERVPILVAALREGMLRLAGQEGDGAIINWLSAADVKTVSKIVHDQGPKKEIVARIFVCPNEDSETVRLQAKRAIASYLNVPVYRKFHEWLGRSDVLGEHWKLWDSGDRAGSLEAMPDSVVDDLIVHGTPKQCREHIDQYIENGVTTAALMIMPFGGIDPYQAIEDLAPR